METVRLDALFEVKRGQSLNFEGLKSGDVSYVSSGSTSNGVIGQVNLPIGFNSISPGAITVARSGSVGFAAYHDVPIFVNENAFYLTPKKEYEPEDLLYYVMVLRNNSKRFGYGRTITEPKLSALQLPAEPPAWVYDYSVDTILGEFDKAMVERKSDVAVGHNIDTSDWVEFRIGDLFDIRRGTGYALTNLPEGNTPLISARESDNSVAVHADVPAKFEANTITVTTDGAVGYATVQDKPFDIASNARALIFKGEHEPTVLAKLAVCTLIRVEGQRFGYARKLNQERLENMTVRLPAAPTTTDGVSPDWDHLDAKMQELAFSQFISTHG